MPTPKKSWKKKNYSKKISKNGRTKSPTNPKSTPPKAEDKAKKALSLKDFTIYGKRKKTTDTRRI